MPPPRMHWQPPTTVVGWVDPNTVPWLLFVAMFFKIKLTYEEEEADWSIIGAGASGLVDVDPMVELQQLLQTDTRAIIHLINDRGRGREKNSENFP